MCIRDRIYCAPGNAGISQYAECVNIGAMEFEKLAAFAKEKEIDLTVVGMDDPLVGGVVDIFERDVYKRQTLPLPTKQEACQGLQLSLWLCAWYIRWQMRLNFQ